METLRDHALAAEGTPIPADKIVRIEFIERFHQEMTTMTFDATAETDIATLRREIDDFFLAFAAEGMDGAISWSIMDREAT